MKNHWLYISASVIAVFALVGSMSFAQSKKATNQKIVPAPVHYWADISNGGSLMGMGMPSLPFGMGKSKNNNWSDAYQGMPGKHADLTISHSAFPNQIKATQSIPNGAGMGKSLNLLPVTPNKTTTQPTEELQSPIERYKLEKKDFKLTFYWGCGGAVKAGQPKVIQIKDGKIIANNFNMQHRGETPWLQNNEAYSRWPNAKDSRGFGSGVSLSGNNKISGANIPESLAFTVSDAQDFMDDLKISSSGDKNGIMTISWNNDPIAKAYFFSAIGMSGKNNELVMWSSADVPDDGSNLFNYLSADKIAQYLKEKALLPASQNKCDVPKGIFANVDMVMVRGIAYGPETYIVYPERPKDPAVTWVQEWTAQIRNKSLGMHMIGMGGMMMGSATAGMSEEEQRQARCDAAKNKSGNVGSAIGSALGGGVGGLIGGAVGKKKGSENTECN
jgi:hypothetical protein